MVFLTSPPPWIDLSWGALSPFFVWLIQPLVVPLQIIVTIATVGAIVGIIYSRFAPR